MDKNYREIYCRNIAVDEIGEKGQELISKAKVTVIGAGGLGSSAMSYLACAGLKKIKIIDNDVVEKSNLNRQILHSEESINIPKVLSAKESLLKINKHCEIESVQCKVDKNNLPSLLKESDMVLDCTDNFPVRFEIAESCWNEKYVLVSASAQRWGGQLFTQKNERGKSCFRCMFPEIPNEEKIIKPEEDGILGAVAGIMGSFQALEAIRQIVGIKGELSEKLLSFDALTNRIAIISRQKDVQCNLCSKV